MSDYIPPKGSADWVAEQDGGDNAATSAAPKGTLDWASQEPPAPEPAKGTQEWAEQNAGNGESKPTPATDTAQKADDPAGVSAHNDAAASGGNANAVMGYDQQIATLTEAANKLKPETEEERKKRERKERSKQIIAAVGDGLMALSNLYFTTKGAPNMYNHETMSQQKPLQDKLDKLKKEREANADKYLQYSLKIGDLNNDRAKTLREMEEQQERMKLAREKAQREQEAHGWLAALQPDKQREQAGKATKAEQEGITATEEAKNAPAMQKAKLETEKARGEAARASATASRASARNSDAAAREHDRGNRNEFSAWDENGREHTFRTKEAAEAYAKQHGTFQETEETTNSESEKFVGGTSTGKTKSSSTKKGGYPKRVTPPAKPQGKGNGGGGNGKWASGLKF